MFYESKKNSTNEEARTSSKEMVAYLENLKQVTEKRAACFARRAADSTKALAAIKEILTKKGYSIIKCFSCFGKFAGLSKGVSDSRRTKSSKGVREKLKMYAFRQFYCAE